MGLLLRLLSASALVIPAFAAFIEINTNVASEVATFQLGATVVGFDDLTGAATVTDGTAIPAASQLDNQLKGTKGVFFTSGGNTPVAVLNVTGLGIAHSVSNVIAPLAINTEELCASTAGCFLEVFFTAPGNKFGAWFDNADAKMFLFWTDMTSSAVDAKKGNFAGGFDSEKTLDHVTVIVGASGPVTLDDITFGASSTSTVPEPATWSVFALAGGLLLVGRMRRR